MEITINVNDCDMDLRMQIAKHTRNTTSLAILANDEEWKVRAIVAENSATAVSTLEKLARDKSRVTRLAVAKNTNATTEILEKLAGDKNWGIRHAIKNNPNTSRATFRKLSIGGWRKS